MSTIEDITKAAAAAIAFFNRLPVRQGQDLKPAIVAAAGRRGK
jgi:hypothetical protein